MCGVPDPNCFRFASPAEALSARGQRLEARGVRGERAEARGLTGFPGAPWCRLGYLLRYDCPCFCYAGPVLKTFSHFSDLGSSWAPFWAACMSLWRQFWSLGTAFWELLGFLEPLGAVWGCGHRRFWKLGLLEPLGAVWGGGQKHSRKRKFGSLDPP